MGIDREALKKIAGAKPGSGGNYLVDGDYVLTVRKFFGRKSNKGEGQLVIAEFLVESSKGNGEVENGVPVVPNAPGTTASRTWKVDKFLSAAGNVKSFVLGILGLQDKDITEEHYMSLLEKVSDDATNPLRGMRVKDSTYASRTGNKTKFTNDRWEKVAQTKDEVKARRAAMDSGDANATSMPEVASTPAPAPVAPKPAASSDALDGLL